MKKVVSANSQTQRSLTSEQSAAVLRQKVLDDTSSHSDAETKLEQMRLGKYQNSLNEETKPSNNASKALCDDIREYNRLIADHNHSMEALSKEILSESKEIKSVEEEIIVMKKKMDLKTELHEGHLKQIKELQTNCQLKRTINVVSMHQRDNRVGRTKLNSNRKSVHRKRAEPKSLGISDVCYKCGREVSISNAVWVCCDCIDQDLTHLSSRNYKEKERLRGDKLCCVCGHKVKISERTKTSCQACSDSCSQKNQKATESQEHIKKIESTIERGQLEMMLLKQEKSNLKKKMHSQSNVNDNNERSASPSSSSRKKLNSKAPKQSKSTQAETKLNSKHLAAIGAIYAYKNGIQSVYKH